MIYTQGIKAVPSAGKLGGSKPAHTGTPDPRAQRCCSGWACLHPGQGRGSRESFLCLCRHRICHISHPRNRMAREGWEILEPTSPNPAHKFCLLFTAPCFKPPPPCAAVQVGMAGNGSSCWISSFVPPKLLV